jgi:hypothetical protein
MIGYDHSRRGSLVAENSETDTGEVGAESVRVVDRPAWSGDPDAHHHVSEEYPQEDSSPSKNDCRPVPRKGKPHSHPTETDEKQHKRHCEALVHPDQNAERAQCSCADTDEGPVDPKVAPEQQERVQQGEAEKHGGVYEQDAPPRSPAAPAGLVGRQGSLRCGPDTCPDSTAHAVLSAGASPVPPDDRWQLLPEAIGPKAARLPQLADGDGR